MGLQYSGRDSSLGLACHLVDPRFLFRGGIICPKKITLFFTILGILIALLVTLRLLIRTSVAGPGIPDTPETRQIQATMRRAYELMAVAARTFDVSEFPTVFADVPEDYKLNDRQREAIVQILGAEVAERAGYLSAIQAYYIGWGKGAALLEKALEEAERERRPITADEMRAITEASGGRVPTLARQDPIYETKLQFESIEIRGNRAVVRYDDGAALQEAILRKISGRWLITSIKPIWVHY